MNRLENDLQFGRYVSYTRTNNICDHCGRTSTLEGICESSNKPYPTGWYCSDCLAKLYAGKWRGSENPTIINGAQFQPEAGRVNISPSVWTAPVIDNNFEDLLKASTKAMRMNGGDGSMKDFLERTLKLVAELKGQADCFRYAALYEGHKTITIQGDALIGLLKKTLPEIEELTEYMRKKGEKK